MYLCECHIVNFDTIIIIKMKLPIPFGVNLKLSLHWREMMH